MLESWTVLSALAALTNRVRLGPLVLGNTYRHPAVVANMAASLDQVSAAPVPAAPDGEVIGTPERITEALGRYADSRVSEFIVRDHGDMPVGETLDTMSVLASDVLPRLS